MVSTLTHVFMIMSRLQGRLVSLRGESPIFAAGGMLFAADIYFVYRGRTQARCVTKGLHRIRLFTLCDKFVDYVTRVYRMAKAHAS